MIPIKKSILAVKWTFAFFFTEKRRVYVVNDKNELKNVILLWKANRSAENVDEHLQRRGVHCRSITWQKFGWVGVKRR